MLLWSGACLGERLWASGEHSADWGQLPAGGDTEPALKADEELGGGVGILERTAAGVCAPLTDQALGY